MDKAIISEALGHIDEKYIIEALGERSSFRAYAHGKENENMNRRTFRKSGRIVLVAAILALVLGITAGAYVADLLGFRALVTGENSLDDPSKRVVSLTQPQETPDEFDVQISVKLAASEAAWAEWSEYKTNRPFNLDEPEVYKNIPEGTYMMEVSANAEGGYIASYYDESGELLEETVMSAEEYEAMRAYDEIMVGGVEGYDFNYNVCSLEEAEKLEEIAERYGLDLRGEANVALSSETTGQSGEGFFTNAELTGLTATKMGNSGNIFNEVPVGFDKLYWFDEGSFCVSYYAELPSSGEQVSCYGYNSMYSTLSSGKEVVNEANIEEFAAREYTAADGTVLTILENGSEAYIYAFLENSFYVQHVGSADMTAEDVNYIADIISYVFALSRNIVIHRQQKRKYKHRLY